MGATYTRQSTYSDGDVITAAHTNDEFNQLLAAFQASSGHTHDGTANEGGPITKLLGTSLTFGEGSTGTDITITFDGESNDGVLKWMEDEDYFEFSDDILVASTEKLQFRDTALYINSSTDGQLDIVADTEVQIAATTIDINGNADISGNLGIGGNLTVTGTTTFNGGTLTLGDANTDNIVFGGEVDSDIIPDDDDTHDLGSSGKQWKDIYIDGTAYLDAIDFNGTAISATAAELNIMDGVTATTAELNIMDGDTSATSTTVADADRVVLNDAGTMKQVAVTDLAAYFDDEITAMPNLVTTAATTVGALNSGSITSGFGTIDTGSSTITTTGLITGGSLDIDDVVINGTTIGHTDDTDLITLADGVVTIAGDLTISGDDLTMGTNTSGHIMVADGTNFNPVAVSGDVTISSAGAVTIANDAVQKAMVNADVITGQTAETSLDTSNDTILIHDASASALRKTTLASVSSALGGITDVVADTSPQLGGNLDTNSHNILIDDAHFIADENGNEQIIFQTTASAVNQLDVTNAATGNAPEISATGGDTNISLKLTPKGSGQVLLDGNVGVESGTIDLKNSGSRSKINFYCESGNAHAQALQAAPHSESASNTLTLPSTGGDVDLVSTASTATLTNKTLTSPKINEDVALTATATELNLLDGVSGLAQADFTKLAAVDATAAELNLTDGSSAGTIVNSKAVIYGSSGEVNATTLQIAGTSITASAADINLIDGITNGTVIASKAIITDSDKDISGGRNITISGELDAATLDISGDADIDGTLEADAITVNGTALNTVIANESTALAIALG